MSLEAALDPIDYKRYRQLRTTTTLLKATTELVPPCSKFGGRINFRTTDDNDADVGHTSFLEHIANCGRRHLLSHVVRHGLDMAYSNDHPASWRSWSHLHEIIVPEEEPEIFVAQLEYWIKKQAKH